METLEGLVRRFPGNFDYVRDHIEEWVENRGSDYLFNLARQLFERGHRRKRVALKTEYMLSRIGQVLSQSPNDGSARAAFKIAAMSWYITLPWHVILPVHVTNRNKKQYFKELEDYRQRMIAANLAQTQSEEVLLGLIDQYKDTANYENIVMLTVQEMVLRGYELDSSPLAEALQQWISLTNHPLNGLPLSLLKWEREALFYSPEIHQAGGDVTIPLGSKVTTTSSDGDVPTEDEPAPIRPFTEITTPEIQNAILSPFQEWMQEYYTRVEARVFCLDTALHRKPHISLSQILAFGLDCTKNMREKSIDIKEIEASGAFEDLYYAANGGSAYGRGEFGAFSRLSVWKSMTALVSDDLDLSASELDSLVNKSYWFDFDPRSWFYRVAWDVGLMVLRPDHKTVAFVVATNTD